jgi:hypothetical protein
MANSEESEANAAPLKPEMLAGVYFRIDGEEDFNTRVWRGPSVLPPRGSDEAAAHSTAAAHIHAEGTDQETSSFPAARIFDEPTMNDVNTDLH